MNDKEAKGIAILGALTISFILAVYTCSIIELL